MKKLTFLAIFPLLLFSCKNKDNIKNVETDKAIIEREIDSSSVNISKEDKEDFPIVSTNIIGFENHKEFDGTGPSFKAKLTFKNNTLEKINTFKLRCYIEIKFKDGKYYYAPMDHDERTERENNYFEHSFEVAGSFMKKGDIWLPNETKEFKILVQGRIGGYNFANSFFERTPESLIFVYKYTAIGIDNEYTKIVGNDIMEFWKDYQIKINLR